MDLNRLMTIPVWEWPKDAGRTLLALLRDREGDQGDRLEAVKLAGDYCVINDELAEALLTVLRDDREPDRLRGKAAIAFGAALEGAQIYGFDDPEETPISETMFKRIMGALKEVYHDAAGPREVRRRALEAAVRARPDWVRNAVRAARASADDDWMLTAVFCMRFIDGFEKEILEAMDSRDLTIKREAIMAAGAWGLDEAWPILAALLKSERTPKDLLLAAIEAVGNIRPDEAGELLVDLSESPDEEIAEAAVDVMVLADGILGDEGEDFLD